MYTVSRIGRSNTLNHVIYGDKNGVTKGNTGDIVRVQYTSQSKCPKAAKAYI